MTRLPYKPLANLPKRIWGPKMDRKVFARLKKKVAILYPESPLIGFNIAFNHTNQKDKDFNPECGFTIYPILGKKPIRHWPLAQIGFDGDWDKFAKKWEVCLDVDIAKLKQKIKELNNGTV